ncbi:MAG TPA: acyltransferase [Mucilaginibacter sp.]|jgi:acetyltransferase-like isoleucine patch superfamily enzyme|nr:acyltransferase [Mucilaginibacter sp.]
MSDLLKYGWTYPALKVSAIFKGIYYKLVFKIKKVRFKSLPEIRGNFKFINKGEITFGAGIRFYSTFKSNPIGMSKYCTIFVAEGAKLQISDKCGFSGVSIYCAKSITIGPNLFCGANVNIWDTDFHPIDHNDRINNRDHLAVSESIIIGSDVFVGANSIILKGVTIGDRSVIGASSVVTKNIPPDEIWAGNPAKFIKSLKDI